MEVAIGGNGSTPFQREVREWQRVDSNTGALLTGRLEADRWINGPLSAYGKVVDSQNVSQPNGTQHSHRKQFEVLQARTSSGSLQVVRAQTVQTSSSRWSAGTQTTQSYDGQRFSNGLQLLTNGHDNNNSKNQNDVTMNGHDDVLQYHHHQHQQQQLKQHHLSNTSHLLNSHLMAAPSLKLSTLMKNSTVTTATNGNNNNNINGTIAGNGICNSSSSDGGGIITIVDDRNNSPHTSVSSMSLVQRHQQHLQKHESETQSNSSDVRFLQPTIIESHVGGGGCSSNIEQQLKQNPKHMETFRNERETTHLQRGRSISTDDLATEWDQMDDGSEPSEWRRVSKIRRSFQFPKTQSPPRESPSRPIDLPENSVSVSRIRQELENGRRLNTAMRNNHVDLVALDNILNGTNQDTDVKTIKKATFLTAESLKEIRGKLKKLSDESLYKEDFVTQSDLDKMNATTDANVESGEIIDGYKVQQPVVLQDSQVIHQPSSFQVRPKSEANHTTNSLENRTRCRDTTSAEWHLRRKSYGFEKMTPQDNSMFRSETSTDSGIGRSGELSNWSPTENQSRGTVITFGNGNTASKTTVKVVNGHDPNSAIHKPVVHRRYHDVKDINGTESAEIKRHSIAVDESKYVRDNLRKVFDTKTSIHLNGLYSKDEVNSSSQISVTDENGRRQKRVEFCKTEVHFAAESGRVNIVETDGKPPPTNNFRRRRRSSSNNSTISSAYLEAINSGVPVIHFGDEKKAIFEQETTLEETQNIKNNVTVSIPVTTNETLQEEDEDQFSDEISLRGILKNKPIRPKPYHLGDNIENGDSLWGVRLKPVASEFPRAINNDLQTIEKNIETDVKDNLIPVKSVAERVRIVEERKDGSGYSTKINLNLTNSPYSWEVPELPKSNVMSIELHSPTSTFKKKTSSTSTIVSSCNDDPIALPRSITSVKATRSIEDESTGSNSYQTESIRKIQNKLDNSNNKKEKEPLKVVTGGARKLRDHELSYFGVKINNNIINNDNDHDIKTNSQPQHNQQQLQRNTNNINETNRKLIINNNETNANKWNIPSDNKPDLLKHNPILSNKEQQKHTTIIESNGAIRITNHSSNTDEIKSDDGPIYENLRKPSSYNRKKDLQRDEMILSEMTKAADQALKAVSKDHAHKEHHHHRTPSASKPLDTIDEKRSTMKSQQQQQQRQHLVKVIKPAKSIQQSPSRNQSESFQRPCCSNRPSSASSNESLSRLSSSSSLKGSRSRDSKEKSNEYESLKITKKRTPSTRECTKMRSSNRDTQRTHASSSEDLSTNPKVEIVRRVKRSKPKEKEKITTKSDDHRHKSSTIQSTTTIPRGAETVEDRSNRHRSIRTSADNDDRHKITAATSSSRSSNDARKTSSRYSSVKTDKGGSLSSRIKAASTADHPHKTRIKTSGILTGTTSSLTATGSSSKRSSRDNNRK